MKLNLLTTTPPSPLALICQYINQLLNGGSNAIGTIKLTNGGTTTTLQSNLLTGNSIVFLTPQTAHASTVTGIWVDPTSFVAPIGGVGGTITINHSSVAQSDLTFGFKVVN